MNDELTPRRIVEYLDQYIIGQQDAKKSVAVALRNRWRASKLSPEIAKAVKEKTSEVKAYVVNKEMKEFTLRLGELTDDERKIILDGCLINFYRG